MPSIAAIVLTYNEELHLERCLKSLREINMEVFVIDSFSTDRTAEIASSYGAHFYQNPWVNYASQFNWAITNCPIKSEWVLRIDADEYLSDELIYNLKNKMHAISPNCTGIRIKRLMYFMNKPMKRGGMYPIWHLKMWRKGTAHCEQRWMDERMVLSHGEVADLDGDVIDNNLNNITWWTTKHNGYATREAIDVLDSIYGFNHQASMPGKFWGSSEERRRWFKYRYLRMPLFIRPFLFFLVRYFIQLGFLEGKRGFVWSILQCFWYRFLVDVKIQEAYLAAGKNRESLISYFKKVYGINVLINSNEES